MDSMEHGSNNSQIVDSDPNPDFDFDGKKLHVKSFFVSCSDQEGGFRSKSIDGRSLVPPGSMNGYSNMNLVSDGGGGFLVKSPVGTNLESLELKSKVHINNDGNAKANLDFNRDDGDRMDAARRFRLKMQSVDSFHWFTGGFLASNGHILGVGMDFHRFAHKQ